MWQSGGFLLMMAVGAVSTLCAGLLTALFPQKNKAVKALRQCVFVCVMGAGHFAGSMLLLGGVMRFYTVAGFISGYPVGAKVCRLVKKAVIALYSVTVRRAEAVSRAADRVFAPVKQRLEKRKQKRMQKILIKKEAKRLRAEAAAKAKSQRAAKRHRGVFVDVPRRKKHSKRHSQQMQSSLKTEFVTTFLRQGPPHVGG